MFDLDLSLDDMLRAIDLDSRIVPNPLRATIIPAEDDDYRWIVSSMNTQLMPHPLDREEATRLISWANKKIVDLGQNLITLNPEYRTELLMRYDIGIGNDAAHAFHNAFRHGNKKNPNLPINIGLYVGYKGDIIEIEDSGDGFPVRRTVDLFHRRMEPDIDQYFTDEGDASHILHESIAHISYNDKGNKFRVMRLIAEPPS